MKKLSIKALSILVLASLTAPLASATPDTRTVVQICSENYEKGARPCVDDVQAEFDNSVSCDGVTVTVTSTIQSLMTQSGCSYYKTCNHVHLGASSPGAPGGSGSDCGGG